MKSIDLDTYSTFVRDCYGVHDKTSWTCLLERYRAMTGANAVTLCLCDGRMDVAVGDWDSQGLEEYANHYNAMNPFFESMQHIPFWEYVGQAKPSEFLIPRTGYVKTEYYNDFMKPQGFERPLSGILVFGERGLSTLDATFPDLGRPADEEAAFLQTLIPHLQTAVATSERLQLHSLTQDAATAGLEAIPHGVIGVDRLGHLTQTNTLADHILADNDGLTFDRHQGLTCADPAESRTLLAAIQTACDTAHGDGLGAGSLHNISRPSKARPYEVLVAPSPAGEGGRAGVLLYVTDPERAPEADTDRLGRLLNLSPAQVQVCLLLLKGYSAQEIAFEADRSVATVRAHIRQVLARTGARTQSDLVRKFAAKLPLLHTLQ